MPHPNQQNRSSLAEAHLWVSRLTTVSLEMALPAFLGHWLDNKWDIAPVLTAVGAVLGFVCGLTHLLQMTKEAEQKKVNRPTPKTAPRTDDEDSADPE